MHLHDKHGQGNGNMDTMATPSPDGRVLRNIRGPRCRAVVSFREESVAAMRTAFAAEMVGPFLSKRRHPHVCEVKAGLAGIRGKRATRPEPAQAELEDFLVAGILRRVVPQASSEPIDAEAVLFNIRQATGAGRAESAAETEDGKQTGTTTKQMAGPDKSLGEMVWGGGDIWHA